MPSAAKPRMPTPPQVAKPADAGVAAAGDDERRRNAALAGSGATDVTGGNLKPASTAKKTALGQ